MTNAIVRSLHRPRCVPSYATSERFGRIEQRSPRCNSRPSQRPRIRPSRVEQRELDQQLTPATTSTPTEQSSDEGTNSLLKANFIERKYRNTITRGIDGTCLMGTPANHKKKNGCGRDTDHRCARCGGQQLRCSTASTGVGEACPRVDTFFDLEDYPDRGRRASGGNWPRPCICAQVSCELPHHRVRGTHP